MVAQMEYDHSMTLLRAWKISVEIHLENMIVKEDNLTAEDYYNELVEENKNLNPHRDLPFTVEDEEDLTEPQRKELLGKFDEDDDLTDINALLYRYDTLMLYIKKEWIINKIQEILNQ
jgi:hypothetical protein